MLIICCCSIGVLIFACLQLYFYSNVPILLVLSIFVGSLSAILLVVVWWLYFYWGFKNIFDVNQERYPLLPGQNSAADSDSD